MESLRVSVGQILTERNSDPPKSLAIASKSSSVKRQRFSTEPP